jgi:allene oxide cyclase
MQAPAMAAKHLQFIDIDDVKIAHLNPKGGDSPGDVLSFKGVVKDAGETKQLGTDQGFCILVEPGKSWECSFSPILSEGRINVAGSFYEKGDSDFAVTGGTGAYKSAKGTFHVHQRDTTPASDQVTIELE